MKTSIILMILFFSSTVLVIAQRNNVDRIKTVERTDRIDENPISRDPNQQREEIKPPYREKEQPEIIPAPIKDEVDHTGKYEPPEVEPLCPIYVPEPTIIIDIPSPQLPPMLLPPVTYKSLGRDKLYDEDYLEAINCFNLFIEDDPSDCEAYFLRGLAYTGLLKYERAKKDYKLAIKINPDYAECYYHLGVSFLCLDQRGDAIQNFEYAATLGYEQADYILNKYFR